MSLRIGSLEEAAAWVGEVGLAAVWSSPDLVLPSLWEAIAGEGAEEWGVRDEHGKFVSFTPEFAALWRWKDELPERRLACAGKHLGRAASLIAPGLLAALYALTGREGRPDDFRDADFEPLELEVAEAVLENGPCSGPEVRRLVAAPKRQVDSAIGALQRALVLTNAGVVEQEQGWPAIRNDVFARRWRARLRRLPQPGYARRKLAAQLLRVSGEVSAADVAAVFRWRRREAVETFEELTERGAAREREEDDVRLWAPA